VTAAITIVRNESFFLPLWLAYYGGQFGPENCLVLDHGSTDGSTDGLPCRVVRLGHEPCYDHEWLAGTAAEWQANLLGEGFRAVVCSDVDEMLCHPQGLRRFAKSLPAAACRATGYHLVQGPGEAAYDAARPIMAQRGWWRHDRLYDKTLIAQEPLQWEVGFHFLAGKQQGTPTEGLTLVHLHGFDRAQARQRHEARRGWEWSEEEVASRRGEQWRLEGAALEAWLDEQARGAEAVAGWLREKVPF